ncbi:MAG: SHOCT domain-containing protein [Desulfarculaceae bacterium]|nr:SHOCT domain-containing protein [Desulfarculaceae bacterium]
MNFLSTAMDSLLTPAAQYGPGGGYGGGWGGHMMYGMGWLGGPFMIIFWILLIVAGVALVKWLFAASKKDGHAAPSGPSQDRSLAILRERYAKGEIDQEQFAAMKRELEA